MGRPEAVASCALQALFIPPGCHLLVWGLGSHRQAPLWLAVFHFTLGEGKRVCGDVRDILEGQGQMVCNGAEQRILGIFHCLSLLSSQNWWCRWVTSCYFGNLSSMLTVATWEMTTEFFLSSLFWTLELHLKMKASIAGCFEKDLGDSELS